MRNRTEDLLSVRDDEPIDADVLQRLSEDPDCAAEIDRLRQVRRELQALPTLQPPAQVWERISQAAVAPPRGRRGAWVAGVAVAAIAGCALLLLAVPPRDLLGVSGPAEVTQADERSEPAAATSAPDATREHDAAVPRTVTRTASSPWSSADYAALIEESVRLEQMLAQLRYQRPVMRAGTASTIAVLEQRITFIDGQLSLAAAHGLDAPRQALWRERVDVMNALVHVRLAQAQRIVY